MTSLEIQSQNDQYKKQSSRIELDRDEYDNLKARVLHRDKWKCRHCGRRSGLHCHHIVYRSAGGDDADYNLLAQCNSCHEAIHARHVRIEMTEPAPIGANGSVKFVYLDKWRPSRGAI